MEKNSYVLFGSIVLSYGAIIGYYQYYSVAWIFVFLTGFILTIVKFKRLMYNNRVAHIMLILDLSAMALAWIIPIFLPRFQLVNGYEIFSTITIAIIGTVNTILERRIIKNN